MILVLTRLESNPMIKHIDQSDISAYKQLVNICRDAPIYGTSLLQKFACYKSDWKVCDFWLGFDRDQTASYALCRYQDSYFLAVKPLVTLSDDCLEELAEFCKIQTFHTLEGDAPVIDKLRQLLHHPDYYSCLTMKLETTPSPCPDPQPTLWESYSDLYDMVCKGYDYFREHVEKEPYISALHDQKRNGCVEAWCLNREGERVTSGLLSTAPDCNCATIGTICTLPEMQGKGYAQQMVRYLCQRGQALEKTLYLNCGDESLKNLYQPLGFVCIGHWMVLE